MQPSTGAALPLINGLVLATVSLAFSLSYAALIFSGPLAPGLAEGVSAALIGSAVVTLVIAWRSSFAFAIAGTDGYHCAVLGGVAAAMAATLYGSGRVPTVNALYLIMASAVLSGTVLYAMGAARLGRWIRFIPYPVTGGFIVGLGCLMVAGGVKIVTDLPLRLSNLDALLGTALAWKVAAAVGFGALMALALKRSTHFLVLPGLLAGGTLAALAVLAVCGMPLAQARAEGWLFDLPGRFAVWTPWSPADFALLDFFGLFDHFKDLLTLTLVNALSILMSATGMELETRRDVDLDHELRGHGLAQLASAAAGGFPGFLSASRSLLNYSLGSRTRTAGYVTAAATLGYAVAGPLVVPFVPKAVLAGMIIQMGCVLIWRWVWYARKGTSWSEYLAMLLIALAVITWGFVTGVVLGVVVACLMFAISYSRVSAVKHLLSGAMLSSTMVRSGRHTAIIKEHGDEVRIFVLQGFIFFGTADRLYRQFGEELRNAARPVRYAILDFRFVNGIDSSAVSGFRKIAARAEARGTCLVTTGVAPGLEPELAALASAGWALRYEHLDAGLEWCETELLRLYGPDETMTLPTMRDWLSGELGTREAAAEFLRHVEEREVAEGEYLCREGEPAESMFFIGEGQVSVERAGSEGRPLRLRTLGRHTMIGEMGLYRSETRSASVVARQDSRVYVLTRETLERMRADSPALAEALCVALIKTMAERLNYSNSLNATLQD